MPVSGSGKVYNVKQDGTGDFSTIQACASAMNAGDTCMVYAGTYSENVRVPAGTSGNYKVIKANGSDVVTVRSFVLSSHTKVLGNCGAVPTVQNSCGFSIQNPASPSSAPCISMGSNSTTDVYITNNNLYACGKPMIYGNAHPGVSFIYIQNNTLSYSGITSSTNPSHTQCDDASIPCTGDAIVLLGSNILIANNDLSHYSLGIQFNTSNSVFRNNTFHDQNEYEGRENHHTDAFFSEPADGITSVQHNVIEGNYQHDAVGPNAKGMLSQGDVCAGLCYGLIERFNTFAHIGSGIVVDENAANCAVNPGFHHVKVYNNTEVDINNYRVNGAIGNNYGCNSIYPADLNNIYYYPGSVSNYNAYAWSVGSLDPTFNYGHNLGYCNALGSGNCQIFGFQYARGSFAGDAGNVFGYQNSAPTNNPMFVNYAASDFHLSSGSPAIGAGTYLTTVAPGDSGSGTSLVVTDASYFQDGSGISGVSGDCISVGTAANRVCITSVNYSTNTLTLESSISRSIGQGVYLNTKSDGASVLTGAAPDIGALPYGSH